MFPKSVLNAELLTHILDLQLFICLSGENKNKKAFIKEANFLFRSLLPTVPACLMITRLACADIMPRYFQ